MEAFELITKLSEYATAKGWIFINGDEYYSNADADVEIAAGQLVLRVDLTATPTRGIGNRLTKINYNGLIGLGIKVDSDGKQADLDESFSQKYERRLKFLSQTLAMEAQSIACVNNLQIVSEQYIYAINRFDMNIDFVYGTINFEQESFGT